MVPAGQAIKMFLLDEQHICNDSLKIVEQDLSLFDELSALYLDFLNRERVLLEGETKFFSLCSLCRSQLLKAIADLLRLHVSSALMTSRVGAEAALYALLLSMGRLSEKDYLESEKARTDAISQIGRDLKDGRTSFPKILLAVREARNQHGAHAHADPIALANRLIKNGDGTIKYNVFQELESDLDFRYFFSRILWDGLLYLRAFTYIQQNVYDEDVSQLEDRLEVLKHKLEKQRDFLINQPEAVDNSICKLKITIHGRPGGT